MLLLRYPVGIGITRRREHNRQQQIFTIESKQAARRRHENQQVKKAICPSCRRMRERRFSWRVLVVSVRVVLQQSMYQVAEVWLG